MFSYYGSKSKLVNLYPAPKHGRIIEPFAGSARYALKYFDRDVLIVDAYDVVIKIWQYLQQASEKDILGLPDLTYKQSTDDYNLSEGERLLLGFLVARGSRRPAKVVQKFSSVAQDKKRIAKDLYKIRHWKIQQGDYRNIENVEATWFIDPPYQNVGKAGYNVNERGNVIDFNALGEWCKTRNGQAIVCEVTTADWLPFEPLKQQHGQKLSSTEAIWCNDNWSYQLQFFTPRGLTTDAPDQPTQGGAIVDMGEVNGVKLTYHDGNVYATPPRPKRAAGR